MHLARDVTPVQAERGEAGVLHGGRGGMMDRMAVHRAQLGGGGNFTRVRLRHAAEDRRHGTKFKGKMAVRKW
ncbi:hypothetical protein LBMAG56_27020 [Verrucomicrobiota bacterium]|nr:hypothetical protein LBMAG56_27020 [Verrucomicrobiota bacterium]